MPSPRRNNSSPPRYLSLADIESMKTFFAVLAVVAAPFVAAHCEYPSPNAS